VDFPEPIFGVRDRWRMRSPVQGRIREAGDRRKRCESCLVLFDRVNLVSELERGSCRIHGVNVKAAAKQIEEIDICSRPIDSKLELYVIVLESQSEAAHVHPSRE
jgi:hypothetical protein